MNVLSEKRAADLWPLPTCKSQLGRICLPLMLKPRPIKR